MNWFNKLSGIAPNNLQSTSIPKGKLIENIKNRLLKNSTLRELDNVQDIVYHAIFRHTITDEYEGELHIIEVKLLLPQFIKVIAEAFHKAIPYPKVIIFSSGEKYLLFRDYGHDFPISRYDFTDWVYEEELLVDFSLGTDRQAVYEIAVNNREEWGEFPYQFSNMFSSAESSTFICLRHLIDLLKIREINSGRDYVRPIVTQLVSEDCIEYYNDMPFVLWTDADQQFLRRNPGKSSYDHIDDRRFGIDRRFEPLTEADFTTQSEVTDLLSVAESTALYLDWENNEHDQYDNSDSEDFDFYE